MYPGAFILYNGDGAKVSEVTLKNSEGNYCIGDHKSCYIFKNLKAGYYYIEPKLTNTHTDACFALVPYNPTTASVKNGFYQESGSWKYYKDGSCATTYTGIVKGTINGKTFWYYVKNGVYKPNTCGIAKKADGSSNTWFYVKDGFYRSTATGIAKKADGSSNTWFFVKDGTYRSTATGIAKKADGSSNTWFFVKDGTYRSTATGIARKADGSSNTWFFVKDGTYRSTATGIARKADGSSNTWFYVRDGVYRKYTGRAKKADGSSNTWFYVEDGIYRNITGWCTINGNDTYVRNGVVSNAIELSRYFSSSLKSAAAALNMPEPTEGSGGCRTKKGLMNSGASVKVYEIGLWCPRGEMSKPGAWCVEGIRTNKYSIYGMTVGMTLATCKSILYNMGYKDYSRANFRAGIHNFYYYRTSGTQIELAFENNKCIKIGYLPLRNN